MRKGHTRPPSSSLLVYWFARPSTYVRMYICFFFPSSLTNKPPHFEGGHWAVCSLLLSLFTFLVSLLSSLYRCAIYPCVFSLSRSLGRYPYVVSLASIRFTYAPFFLTVTVNKYTPVWGRGLGSDIIYALTHPFVRRERERVCRRGRGGDPGEN